MRPQLPLARPLLAAALLTIAAPLVLAGALTPAILESSERFGTRRSSTTRPTSACAR
jgi:hypothetical protein